MAFQPNVVNTQPATASHYTVSPQLTDWSTGPCDCCDDCGICACLLQTKISFCRPLGQSSNKSVSSSGLCGAFVPCVLACRVAQDSGENCCLPCLPGALIALRTSMRNKYNISVSVHLLPKETNRAKHVHFLLNFTVVVHLLLYFAGLGVWWLGDHGLSGTMWTLSDGTRAEYERINNYIFDIFILNCKARNHLFHFLGLHFFFYPLE